MQVRGNRTFICSVVFIDIVEYTRKAVTEQIQLKEQLNRLLSEALKDVAANDRIILDTGDGCAISFVGDPEDALFVCLSLRNGTTEQQPGAAAELKMRVGINLGPVKLVRDLNGQPNIIGDGINVAQRIMGFAEPGQVLVSRSYFEVVSCLSETYAKMFHYEGSRTDKHVREHEVYAVGEGSGEIQRKIEAAQAASTGAHPRARPTWSVADKLAATTNQLKENLRTRPRVSTAVAVVAILVLAIGMRGLRANPDTRAGAKAPAAPVVTKKTGPKPDQKIAVAPANPATTAKPAPAATEKAAAPTPKPAPAAREKVAAAPQAAPAARPKPAASSAPSFITFAVTPWGEIHVDGKIQGVSPPLRELQVSPGRHKIEVRNTSFPPHVETVEITPGEKIRIRHRFR
jgi:class 3 adenylate cyclase